jgi:hypothetical protein
VSPLKYYQNTYESQILKNVMAIPNTPSVNSGLQSKKQKKRSEDIRVGGGVFTSIRKNEDIHELLSS